MTPSAFVCSLLEAAEEAHERHLTSDSYAVHKHLEELYGALPDAVDALAEVYQGLTSEALDLASEGGEMEFDQEEPLEFVQALRDFTHDNRDVMGDLSAVQALVDEVESVIGRACYRLERLQ